MNGLDNVLTVVTGDVAAAKRDLTAARMAYLAQRSDANLRRWNAALMRVYLASAGVVDEAHEQEDEDEQDESKTDPRMGRVR
jgi:hypothetical protein